MRAQNNGSGNKPGDSSCNKTDKCHQDRVGNTEMGSGDAGTIGTSAKQSSMAERCYTAIAHHQIE